VSRFKIEINATDPVSGERLDPELIAKHAPKLIAFAERYGEFLLAMGNDDDLALIARTCALCELFLREAINDRLAKPELFDDAWRRVSYWLRVRLALALDLIPIELKPLFEAVGVLRNKVLHDTPQGSISEQNVAGLLAVAPKEVLDQLDAARASVGVKNPKMAALPSYQRDLRIVLLVLYSTCYAASGRHKSFGKPPTDGGPESASTSPS
jgi:hypothetical protein